MIYANLDSIILVFDSIIEYMSIFPHVKSNFSSTVKREINFMITQQVVDYLPICLHHIGMSP